MQECFATDVDNQVVNVQCNHVPVCLQLAQRISDISVTEQLRQSVGDYVQSGQGGVPSSGPSSPSKEKELISGRNCQKIIKQILKLM